MLRGRASATSLTTAGGSLAPGETRNLVRERYFWLVPYSATAYRLLISAPGDVTESDIRTVNETIARWNAG